MYHCRLLVLRARLINTVKYFHQYVLSISYNVLGIFNIFNQILLWSEQFVVGNAVVEIFPHLE